MSDWFICEQCGRGFANQHGLMIHIGQKHKTPARCRWTGEDRGWCSAHDAAWRVDSSTCSAMRPLDLPPLMDRPPLPPGWCPTCGGRCRIPLVMGALFGKS